jgi:hypothetical protein
MIFTIQLKEDYCTRKNIKQQGVARPIKKGITSAVSSHARWVLGKGISSSLPLTRFAKRLI